jgi:hypothetical protein
MFLTVGFARAPEVVMISEQELTFLDMRIRREGHTRKAYEPVFGEGVDHVWPCWSKDLMTDVAMNYTGSFEVPTRWFASRIALGMTYSREELEKGGDGDTAKPVKPVPRKPPPAPAQKPETKTEEREAVLAGAVGDQAPRLRPRPRRK